MNISYEVSSVYYLSVDGADEAASEKKEVFFKTWSKLHVSLMNSQKNLSMNSIAKLRSHYQYMI